MSRVGMNSRGELNSRVRAGRALAAEGWRVLLLAAVTRRRCSCRKAEGCPHPGKHPLIRDWQDRATDDPDRLVADQAYGTDWNLGLLCGAPLRALEGRALVVLDVDPEGVEAYAALVRRRGRLPETATVMTGEGMHHYYAAAPGSRSFKFSAGLEVKATGSLVVCPPSVHFPTFRRYRWLTPRDTIAPAPAWLLRQPVERTSTAEPVPVVATESVGVHALAEAGARLRSPVRRDGVANRRGRLYAAAAACGEYVAAGLLDRVLAATELQAVSDDLGVEPEDGARHIRRGLDHGSRGTA